MKKLRSCRPHCRASALLVLVGIAVVPASASPVFFDLSNVTFVGGITATGSFAFDSSTDAFTSVDVTVSGPSTGFFGFFAAGAVAFDTVDSAFNSPLELILLPPGGAVAGNLNLLSLMDLSSTSPVPILLAGGSSGFASALEINGSPMNDIQTLSSSSASLVPQSATPEPGTAGLVALALGTFVVARKGILMTRRG